MQGENIGMREREGAILLHLLVKFNQCNGISSIIESTHQAENSLWQYIRSPTHIFPDSYAFLMNYGIYYLIAARDLICEYIQYYV